MNYKPTKNEFLLAVRRMSFASGDSLPLTFKLGDRVIRGIPKDFSPTKTDHWVDTNLIQTVIEGKKDGLAVRAEVLRYLDLPAVEYTVWFTNEGDCDTEILSEIHAIDHEFCGENPILHHGNGDNIVLDGYTFFDDPITPEPMTIAPNDDGTSCNGAYPFMRVIFEDYVLTAAIGWSGSWKATFAATPLGVQMKAGQKYTNFGILPGETMRTPRITLLISETPCQTRACNLWRRFYFDHMMPKQWGNMLGPKMCAHVYGYKATEFCGATEDNQIEGLRRYIKRGMKPDVWWMDAGYYPCVDQTWQTVGTWKEDPVRWPNNGLGGLGRECAENGIDFLVWFEPERVSDGSEIEREHPDFLLRVKQEDGTFISTSLLDLGNPEALSWIIERVDSLIKKWNVKIYRQDFNFPPAPWWRQNEAPDRLGALENKHIQGYYKYWDELRLRNPGLLLDSCASGGRRNDPETLRRAVSLHYTDIGIQDPAQKEKQHLMLFEWMPYFRAHLLTDGAPMDSYHWFTAFAPAISYMPSAWGSEAEYEFSRRMRPIWEKAAELETRGDYYRQCTLPQGEELKHFLCIHFYDSDRGDGFVMFLRNAECEEESFTATLAVEDGYRYRLENPLSGESCVMPAAELKTLSVTLEKKQGALWFLTRLP